MADVKLSTPRLRVVLADGTDREVQCTNADMVRFDLTRSKQKWPGAQDAPFLWLTFVAWAALRRTGVIEQSLGYEAFRRLDVGDREPDRRRRDRRGRRRGPYPRGTRAHLIVSLAVATSTSPSDWWHEDDATIATALQLLEEAREEVEESGS